LIQKALSHNKEEGQGLNTQVSQDENYFSAQTAMAIIPAAIAIIASPTKVEIGLFIPLDILFFS
jgi:hypothetical protein